MKWQIEKIKEMDQVQKDGESYVKLCDVVELLDRKCKDCKYFEVSLESHPVTHRKHKASKCINAVNTYKTNVRYAGGSDTACRRFVRGGDGEPITHN